MPPFNPKDLFLSKLSIVAASSPKMLLNTPKISYTPPYLDFFDSPKLMALPLK